MSEEHDAPAMAKREPTISDADRDAIGKASRAKLRDEFAKAALIGILAAGDGLKYNRKELAVEAWAQADVMLKARGDD